MYAINPDRIFDLPCFDGRKSFYGKAKVIECDNGRYLQSYDTLVCFISYGGTFQKLWDNYSVTTMRHINSFMDFIGWNEYGGKKWWTSLEVNVDYDRFSMQHYNEYVRDKVMR